MRIFQAAFHLVGGLLAVGMALVITDYFLGNRNARELREEPPLSPDTDDVPTVSVVIAACNEEEKFPDAFRTLIAQEYPGRLELIVAEDRSTDTTPALADALAIEATDHGKAAIVLHIEHLPPGWLGKTHALYQGAANAGGEYLLFADADIHFAPDALARAVGLMRRENLDHLTVFPELFLRGFRETLFGLTFSYFFVLKFRPWRVRDPKAKEYLGVGAFNMVRRDAYDRVGTHRRIALEVADDMELGHRIKEEGLRSDVVGASGLVGVRWQESFAGLLNGLVKNAYSGFHFSPLNVFLGLSQMIVGIFLPPVGALLATDRRARAAYAVTSLSLIAGGAHHARRAAIPMAYALCLPVSAALLFYVTLRSMYVTERNGGVTWRNTFYPLAELRTRAIPPPPPPVPPTLRP
ncbi:MAG: glycosyltransferase family 2 protein [Capsulimonadales bacterium]|nr:glycosyltransferase family 2 protein [Capsulimonadales bacterium]